MNYLQIWLFVEIIHFISDLFICIFFPNKIIIEYTGYTSLLVTSQTYEMVNIIAIFNFAFIQLCIFSIMDPLFATLTAKILCVFHIGFLLRYLFNKGYFINFDKYYEDIIFRAISAILPIVLIIMNK